MASHRVAAVARQLMLAVSMIATYAGGAGSVEAQQVIDHQRPVVTLFTHGVTLTHHSYIGFCDTCDFDSHRFVERLITIFGDGSLRSVDSFNELEDHAPAFASSVSGKGSAASFAALLQAIQSANLSSQTGNCSFPSELERNDPEPGYIDYIEINHDAYLTWLAAGNDQRVELSLNSQGPDCSTALKVALFSILLYEQEVIAYTPHVSAGQ
jgi:hypothetical protein